MKLFAVMLGGRAPRCNVELHDVVFVVGDSIEETYLQLLEKWFGSPEGLHIDSWLELRVIDGHRITLASTASESPKKLYFINLGGYAPGQFTELHSCTCLVATSEREVKVRAKESLMRGVDSVHTDDLYDVDDCLEVSTVNGFSIQLEPTSEASLWEPHNGYHIIPKPLVRQYLEAHPERAAT